MYKIKKIVSGAFYTNTYLLIDNKDAIIIDPTLDFKEYAREINEKYNVLGVLLTHGHIDHVDGVRYFNSDVYVTKEDEIMLKDSNLSLYSMTGQITPYKNTDINFINIKDGDILNIGPFQIKVLLTKGHTSGSVCYLINNNLFSGDTMFKYSVGRTDFPTGSENELRKSIKKLLNLSNEVVVYPGHDDKTTIKDEKKYNIYR